MSFEEIKNLSLICVFIWLIYEINWKSKHQEGGKWGAFGSAGIAAVLFIGFTVLRFAMGRCGPASLDDLLVEEREEHKRSNVRLRAIGHLGELPPYVQRVLRETIEFLDSSTGLTLVLALSYGGRDEIVDAARRLAQACLDGELTPDRIGPAEVASRLHTADIPDPDLLIRTSGEMRISNFLLWQLAYAEIYITPIMWPDFRGDHLIAAVEEYNRRERRFGRVE